MNLTAERFRKLLQSLEQATAATRPRPDEQRKATRVGVRMALDLQELDGDRLLPPKRAHSRDMSSTGIGFNYYKALEIGSRIVFAFPSSFGDPPLYVLYEVKNRRPLGEQLFGIGAVVVEVGYTPPPQTARPNDPAAAGKSSGKASQAKVAVNAAAAMRPRENRPDGVAAAQANAPAVSTSAVSVAPPASPPMPAAPSGASADEREALAQRIRSAMFEDR